jgi:hypothetical protein
MKENIGISHNAVRSAARFELLRDLEYALRVATFNDDLTLIDHGDNVIIDHGNGTAQKACVECDSILEMAYDIMKAALHGEYFDYDPSKEDETYED